MPEDRRRALEAAAEALMNSRSSAPDKAALQEAMDAIQDELDTLVLDDLNAAAAACGRAADAMQDVIDMINQHAPEQIAQAARDAVAKLRTLSDTAEG